MMKPLSFLIMLICLLSSCEEDDPSGVLGNDSVFDFAVVSSEGVDLLDPATPGGINPDSVDVYEEIDGNLVLLHNRLWSDPNGIFVHQHEGKYLVRLTHNSLLFTEKVGPTRFVLDWKTADPDTLDAYMTRLEVADRWLTLERLEVNGVEVWSLQTHPEDLAGDRYFELVVE